MTPRSNRKKHIPYNLQHYKDRNCIERMFNKLKQFRRIATHYDKTRKSFLAFLHIAAVKLWLPYFVNRTQHYR
ncbi:transposase [Zymomonas mobilis]|uniref:transposase n=1 Tax=Zymomonas mobilis TaxID=542 RepID=UPI00208E8CD2|nr:transposase [Zymomonas mobilis]